MRNAVSGPLWWVFALGALAVLLVLFVRRLRQVSEGSGTMIAAGVVAALVVAGVALLLLLR